MPTKISMKSFGIFRARLFAGGTFFRAKKPGQYGNRISVEILALDNSSKIITIDGMPYLDSVNFRGIGNGTIHVVFSPEVKNTNIDILALNDWAFQILTGEDKGGIISVGQPFRSKDLSITITKGSIPFVSGDSFSMAIYKPFEQYEGKTVQDIQILVNENSSLIEMPPRGYDYVDISGTNHFGQQVRTDKDLLVDGETLELLSKTFLSGGDGIPEDATGLWEIPVNPIIHVDRIENEHGEPSMINRTYLWEGPSLYEGHFVEKSNRDLSFSS